MDARIPPPVPPRNDILAGPARNPAQVAKQVKNSTKQANNEIKDLKGLFDSYARIKHDEVGDIKSNGYYHGGASSSLRSMGLGSIGNGLQAFSKGVWGQRFTTIEMNFRNMEVIIIKKLDTIDKDLEFLRSQGTGDNSVAINDLKQKLKEIGQHMEAWKTGVAQYKTNLFLYYSTDDAAKMDKNLNPLKQAIEDLVEHTKTFYDFVLKNNNMNTVAPPPPPPRDVADDRVAVAPEVEEPKEKGSEAPPVEHKEEEKGGIDFRAIQRRRAALVESDDEEEEDFSDDQDVKPQEESRVIYKRVFKDGKFVNVEDTEAMKKRDDEEARRKERSNRRDEPQSINVGQSVLDAMQKRGMIGNDDQPPQT